ncbi:MAG: bacteriocin [Lactobacillales bacterium]|nr:bacteriocin [Lactobacillales bacterium]
MEKFKELNITELEKVSGGSSDGFWTSVGEVSGKQFNCIKNHPVKHFVIPCYCLVQSFR